MSVIVILFSLSSYSSRVVLVLQQGGAKTSQSLPPRRNEVGFGAEMGGRVERHEPFSAIRLSGFRGRD